MTSNQLQYWRNVETERANKAAEGIKQQEADTHAREAKVKEDQLALDQWVEEYKKWLAYDHQENEYRDSISKLVSVIIGNKGLAGFASSVAPMLAGIFG